MIINIGNWALQVLIGSTYESQLYFYSIITELETEIYKL
jgi:hypothetical protein